MSLANRPKVGLGPIGTYEVYGLVGSYFFNCITMTVQQGGSMGVVLGVRTTPPPPFRERPNVIKREKNVARVRAKKVAF